MPESRGDVTIVVPVHNEIESIEGTLTALCDLREALTDNLEIILVDDGSCDGTEKLLAAKPEPDWRVIRHRERRGYGRSLKSGIAAAAYDVIAITDADGTYPIEKLPTLIKELRDNDCDMVVGARTGKSVKIPLARRPARWVLQRLANFLSGKKIPDLNSGMRVMRKTSLEKFIRILPDGFSFTTTLTLGMLTNGCDVKFLPIDYHQRKGHSKIRPIYDTLNFLQLIARTVLYFNPLRIFMPLSLILALLAFVILGASLVLFDRAMDVTFGVVLMTAVMVLTIGLLADLIDKRL
jgi:glycosyltransferase involved in cell wall biosynthesis